MFLRRVIFKDDLNLFVNLKIKKLFIGGLNEEVSEEDIKSVLFIFIRYLFE